MSINHKRLITGATGDLGRRVINQLKQQLALDQLSVLIRDSASALAQTYQSEGIEVRIGDYTQPASLLSAFEGIDILYFISASDDEQRTQLHQNVVQAAIQARVSHIIYTSAVWKDETGSSPLSALVDSHRQTEQLIQASGLTYTILKHNLYAEVIQLLIGDRSQLRA
jgi:NAD(P)H dehydrogenase (quinone)